MVRVLFRLADGGWHGSATERLWATPLDEGYRLENSPFYAEGISFDDVIAARETNGELEYDRVLRHSGHSTYRLLPAKNWEEMFEGAWKSLQAIGCTFEEGHNGLLTVDIPPEADIYAVYQMLENGERSEIWSFEEGHCGHQKKAKPNTSGLDS